MAEDQDKIDELLSKLDVLLEKQSQFSREIDTIKKEVNSLQLAKSQKGRPVYTAKVWPDAKKAETAQKAEIAEVTETPKVTTAPSKRAKLPGTKDGVERFIGENLISKVGIAITVIGVGIGARYAIEHQLISPLTRIIIGYLVGAGLLGVALWLRSQYEGFSAVLLSGAMAIMYFITFTAYDFYDLMPHLVAFLLMVAFTVFTVLAAVSYNQQVIAHVGLVGAYAVPFLLSQESGRMEIFFTYVAIINVGILAIGLKRYWKSLYYAAFAFTWLIFLGWYGTDFYRVDEFGIAFAFVCVFYVLFYLTFVAYKVLHDDPFDKGDVVLILSNSFIFYAVGYDLLSDREGTEHLLGLFTLGNAAIHFLVAALIHRQKLQTRSPFYLVAGLVMVFVTIAIPVQLEGNWVTLLWVAEAAALFWIGRSQGVPVYEKLSYPLMLLAFVSLLHDWSVSYGNYVAGFPDTSITPLLNINFLTSVIFSAALGLVNYTNSQRKLSSESAIAGSKWWGWMGIAIPGLFLISLYGTFFLEIYNYWDQLYKDSLIDLGVDEDYSRNYIQNTDLPIFQRVWLINYTLVFLSALVLVDAWKIKNKQLTWVNLVLLINAILICLISGLTDLTDLRASYLDQTLSDHYTRGPFHVWIRYVSFAIVGASLWAAYQYVKTWREERELLVVVDAVLHIVVLTIASSELIHWMDMAGSEQSYKLGLSILWGSYALFAIVLGIWKKRKHLRIGAIALFAVTLVKLFFYDIAHLGTIDKTIVLVSLGVLLLTVSFLYNKYKHLIN